MNKLYQSPFRFNYKNARIVLHPKPTLILQELSLKFCLPVHKRNSEDKTIPENASKGSFMKQIVETHIFKMAFLQITSCLLCFLNLKIRDMSLLVIKVVNDI